MRGPLSISNARRGDWPLGHASSLVSGAIGLLLKLLVPRMSKTLVMRSGEKGKQEKTPHRVIQATVKNNRLQIKMSATE
jgi:hypothetical protein